MDQSSQRCHPKLTKTIGTTARRLRIPNLAIEDEQSPHVTQAMISQLLTGNQHLVMRLPLINLPLYCRVGYIGDLNHPTPDTYAFHSNIKAWLFLRAEIHDFDVLALVM